MIRQLSGRVGVVVLAVGLVAAACGGEAGVERAPSTR